MACGVKTTSPPKPIEIIDVDKPQKQPLTEKSINSASAKKKVTGENKSMRPRSLSNGSLLGQSPKASRLTTPKTSTPSIKVSTPTPKGSSTPTQKVSTPTKVTTPMRKVTKSNSGSKQAPTKATVGPINIPGVEDKLKEVILSEVVDHVWKYSVDRLTVIRVQELNGKILVSEY